MGIRRYHDSHRGIGEGCWEGMGIPEGLDGWVPGVVRG